MIRVLESIIQKKNEESACGFCWEFILNTGDDYLSRVETRTDCPCGAYFIVHDIQIECESGNHGLENNQIWNLGIFIGVPSSMGQQFYNENSNGCKADSKYAAIIEPLINCFGCFPIECSDECNSETDTTDYKVDTWRITGVKHNSSTNLFDGIEITAQFTVNG